MRRPLLPRLSLIVALAAGLGATACDPFAERAPKLDQPERFGEGDLHFEYPSNWKVSSERETTEGITIASHTVEPRWGNSMLIVQVFTPGVPVDFDMLLDSFRQGMKESFAGALIQERKIGGKSSVEIDHLLVGEIRPGRRLKFGVSLLGENTENTVDIYVAELEDRTIVVYAQAADEDLAKATVAFEHIMNSLQIDG